MRIRVNSIPHVTPATSVAFIFSKLAVWANSLVSRKIFIARDKVDLAWGDGSMSLPVFSHEASVSPIVSNTNDVQQDGNTLLSETNRKQFFASEGVTMQRMHLELREERIDSSLMNKSEVEHGAARIDE